MGNLYRFVEPVLLYLLKKKGRSYGYELAVELREHALTDASIEAAALYSRTTVSLPSGMSPAADRRKESTVSRPVVRST